MQTTKYPYVFERKHRGIYLFFSAVCNIFRLLYFSYYKSGMPAAAQAA